jgi:hypothetical protein
MSSLNTVAARTRRTAINEADDIRGEEGPPVNKREQEDTGSPP